MRNLRADRGSELRLGRQREPIGVEELSDDAKHQNRNSGESLLVISCSGPEPTGYRLPCYTTPGKLPEGDEPPLRRCPFGPLSV